MIYSLLLLSILVWPFGQLLSFVVPTLPFTIYLLDFVVLALSISLICSSKRKQILSTSLTRPLIIFLGAATLSFVVNIKQGIAAGLPLSMFYLLRLLIYPSLFFGAVHVGFKRLKTPIAVSIIIFLVICLFQYLVFPDMRFLKNIGFDDHYFRLIGSFYDPNFTGAILAALALYLVEKNKLLLSVPFIGLLALTFSRASYLVFIIGIIYLLLINKRIKLFFLLILLGIAVYLIPKPFGEGVNLLRTFSIFSRIESWQSGLTLFLQRPIFGWGYNTLRSVDGSRFQIDNSFIFLLATTGIVGLISFVNLIFHIFKNTSNQAIKIIFIAIFFHSIFNNSLFYIWILAFFWFAVGIGQDPTKGYKST